MPHRHPALLRAYERVSASGWSSILGLVPPHGLTIAAFFADWEGRVQQRNVDADDDEVLSEAVKAVHEVRRESAQRRAG